MTVPTQWFQMVLTVVVIVVFVILTALNKPVEAEVFKSFCLVALGYWFSSIGLERRIATTVTSYTTRSYKDNQ